MQMQITNRPTLFCRQVEKKILDQILSPSIYDSHIRYRTKETEKRPKEISKTDLQSVVHMYIVQIESFNGEPFVGRPWGTNITEEEAGK